MIKLEPDCLSVSVNTNTTLQTVTWAHGSLEVGEADLLCEHFPFESAKPAVKSGAGKMNESYGHDSCLFNC